jgi:hypothetical protein
MSTFREFRICQDTCDSSVGFREKDPDPGKLKTIPVTAQRHRRGSALTYLKSSYCFSFLFNFLPPLLHAYTPYPSHPLVPWSLFITPCSVHHPRLPASITASWALTQCHTCWVNSIQFARDLTCQSLVLIFSHLFCLLQCMPISL